MSSLIQDITESFANSPDLLLLGGVAIGMLFFVFGIVSTFSRSGSSKRRMKGGATHAGQAGSTESLVKRANTDPSGLLKAFVPSSRKERTKIGKKMRQAGIHGKDAVRNYYMTRTVLGLILPLLFVGLTLLPRDAALPFGLAEFMGKLDVLITLEILTFLLVVGFFGPALWLQRKIDNRRLKIEQGLPNALDLLQVAVEAGMGFDAALARVAQELTKVAPAITEEFTILQLEIQAGKERTRAFMDMAERTNVDEMSAFANVILQSAQFGTSTSEALKYFADKMREERELRAQEKANKLPVKMSGVMALMMMPTLLMITLAPVIIRLVHMFGEVAQ